MNASNTATEQALQVGFNHDGMHYFPLPVFGDSRGLLVVNHEYTDASQIYSATQGSAITNDAAEKCNGGKLVSEQLKVSRRQVGERVAVHQRAPLRDS